MRADWLPERGLGRFSRSRRPPRQHRRTRSPSGWARRASAPCCWSSSSSDEQLNTVYSPILSPLAWDLGHIANFEELWLVQQVGGREPLDGELGRFYDAIENPRAEPQRAADPARRGAARLHGRRPRARARGARDASTSRPMPRIPGPARRLRLRDADRPRASAQRDDAAAPADGRRLRAAGSDGPAPRGAGRRRARRWSTVAGGTYGIGAGDRGFAYDNERPRHEVELAPFRIDRAPVTNGDFAAFVAETGAEPPMYWERDGERLGIDDASAAASRSTRRCRWSTSTTRQADGLRRLGRQAPADRVRVGGRRGGRRPRARQPRPLAFGDPPAPTPRRRPRGRGADARRRLGVDVARSFDGYPGFEAFPYPEYSEVFFGAGYRSCGAAPGRPAAT